MKMAIYNSELKSSAKKERRAIVGGCIVGFAIWCVILEIGFRAAGM